MTVLLQNAVFVVLQQRVLYVCGLVVWRPMLQTGSIHVLDGAEQQKEDVFALTVQNLMKYWMTVAQITTQ